MITKAYIAEWRTYAPWLQDMQVEQDLIISRVLIELFNESYLKDKLAFRDGTALYKLYINPPLRYSGDVDLVQLNPEPIGPIFDAIKSLLNPLLGQPQWKLGPGRATLYYRYQPESIQQGRAKLKIEINTREHYCLKGIINKELKVKSRWFNGEADIPTYTLDELIGTKLRALYQRKKGRDLFDLWVALQQKELNPEQAIEAFQYYLQKEGKCIDRGAFENNLAEKLTSPGFRQDISPLLSPSIQWDLEEAVNIVKQKFIEYL